MNPESAIYVAGHDGMVGSAICRRLQAGGYSNIITRELDELDLTRQAKVEAFFEAEKPDVVFLAAAMVGGIHANSTRKAEFYYVNAMIATNVIHSAWKSGVKKLMNLGSTCIYPRMAPQPMHEEDFLTGPLEPTNDAYAIAKISAIEMCRFYNDQYGTDFLSAMPTNLFGYHDNFNLHSSHVLPALIRKFHDAKLAGGTVELWGDGSAIREFLFADDLADALLYLMEHCTAEQVGRLVNVGAGQVVTIRELAELIQSVVGFEGEVLWDTSKPNGMPRKEIVVDHLAKLGWQAKTSLRDGLEKTYQWYCQTDDSLKRM